MMPDHLRRLGLTLLLSGVFAGPSLADSVDCNYPEGDIERGICDDPNLATLAHLADVIGAVVGLDVRYAERGIWEDYGLNRAINRLLSTLALDDVAALTEPSVSADWNFIFDDQNKILFIEAKSYPLQNGVVVFDPDTDGTPAVLYVEMYNFDDAGRYSYRTVGNILEVRSSFRPAESVDKYRYQDGCWRLIGSDTAWAGYMIEYNDDIAAQSTNYLTGRSIFDYNTDQGVVRTFDPEVFCLGPFGSSNVIQYHDGQN